jgi:hypothetical protein
VGFISRYENIVFRYIGEILSKVVTERMVKSFLDLFVLDLLDDSPKHGYEIMRELKTRTGATIGAGTLYPSSTSSRNGNWWRESGILQTGAAEESTRLQIPVPSTSETDSRE